MVWEIGVQLLTKTKAGHSYSYTGSAVYLAAAPQQKRAIYSMLAQRLRRWPNNETALCLGDCPVFAGNVHYYAGDAFHLPSPEKSLPR